MAVPKRSASVATSEEYDDALLEYNDEGYTALHSAAGMDRINLMEKIFKESKREDIEKFIDLPTRDGSQSTAVHLAAEMGNVRALRVLLCHGANYEARDRRNKSPIERTACLLVENLLNDVNKQSWLAAYGKHKDLKTMLENCAPDDFWAWMYARNRKGHTSLQTAIKRNHVNVVFRIVEYRIKHQVNGTVIDVDSVNRLARKTGEFKDALYNCLTNQDRRCSRQILFQPVGTLLYTASSFLKDVEKAFKEWYRREYELPSLMEIVRETLQVLEFQHSDMMKNKEIVLRKPHPRYYNRLRMIKGVPYKQEEDRMPVAAYLTILGLTIGLPVFEFFKVMFMWLMEEAVNRKDVVFFKNALSKPFFDINFRDEAGKTAYHLASRLGDYDTVKRMLRWKHTSRCLPNDLSDNETPLYEAIAHRKEDIVELMLGVFTEDELKQCLDQKTTYEGWTPLHLAASTGQWKIVVLLLQYGAVYNARDKQGKRPVDLAVRGSKVEKVLVETDRLFQLAVRKHVDELSHLLDASCMYEGIGKCYTRNSQGLTLSEVLGDIEVGEDQWDPKDLINSLRIQRPEGEKLDEAEQKYLLDLAFYATKMDRFQT